MTPNDSNPRSDFRLPRIEYAAPESDWYCRECAPMVARTYKGPSNLDAVCRVCGRVLDADERRTEALARSAGVAAWQASELAAGSATGSGEEVAVPGLAGRVTLSIEEAARLLGCGRSRVFSLLKEKKLKRAPKAGKATMVLSSSVEKFVLGARGQHGAAPSAQPQASSTPARRTPAAAPGTRKLERSALGDAIRKIPVK